MSLGESENLDHWRDYFRSSNSGIFDIIEHGIAVAAADCPLALKSRRDRIAEKLFSCLLSSPSLDRDCAERPMPKEEDEDGDGGGFGTELEPGGIKESKVNGSRDNNHGDAEALDDEIEEKNLVLREVLRIKHLIDNTEDQTDAALFDSLWKLQTMDSISYEILEVTMIGKSVTVLKKHQNKQIQKLARTLIKTWKGMVDYWLKMTSELVAEATPDSCNPTVINEDEDDDEGLPSPPLDDLDEGLPSPPLDDLDEGLPSPPLDDLAFIDTHTTTFEFSKFFEGIDDDGNLQNTGELNKNRARTRKPVKGTRTTAATETPAPPPPKESKPKPQAHSKPPLKPQLDKSEMSPDDLQAKLEVAKRKLHDGYQQAENAKKQRTIKVVEIRDLPKQVSRQRNSFGRPKRR